MKCKNCNKELDNNKLYCIKCGTYNKNLFTEEEMKMKYKSPEERNLDEFLAKSYIGDKSDYLFEKLIRGRFNVFAALFGITYFIYRKIYKISLILFLILLLLSIIFGYHFIIYNIILGFIFYPTYKYHIDKKVKQIKIKYKNLKENELLEITEKKGGISKIGEVVLIVRSVLLYGIYIFLFVMQRI